LGLPQQFAKTGLQHATMHADASLWGLTPAVVVVAVMAQVCMSPATI
jgi:hypothetical protein